ncbi:cyclic AMP-dependent transcription factor ATF-1 isoform X2 [Ischnura elegans]|nr:cyclic AMP-dependent transcription factor ATF-1 isoform X2 [Ischnura elegans]XP_046390145.1 cyclic AMP-dependent transcription factor ATF-1 isoform X2 [Ischnura elegans]
METMVEENGNAGNAGGDPLAPSPGEASSPTVTSVQSVIQPNQQSVIQTAANIHPVHLSKGNVILVSKPNSVIQTAGGNLQTLQVVETGSDESCSNDDESTKKRRDILTRRPSYRKILNDLGGGEIAVIPAGTIQIATGPGGQGDGVQGLHTLTMTNATAAGGTIVQYAQGQDGQFFVPVSVGGGGGGVVGGGVELEPLGYTVTTTSSSSPPPSPSLSPSSSSCSSSPLVAGSSLGGGVLAGAIGAVVTTNAGATMQSSQQLAEEAARKRELRLMKNRKREQRLMKNREAARECRRKKKEYIKCLENRVAVLENQNKALIDELKALKELYCQQKTECGSE